MVATPFPVTCVDCAVVVIIAGFLVRQAVAVVIDAITYVGYCFGGRACTQTVFLTYLNALTDTQVVLHFTGGGKGWVDGQIGTQTNACRGNALVTGRTIGGLDFLAGIPWRTWGIQVAGATAKTGPAAVFYTGIGCVSGTGSRVFTGQAEVAEFGHADVLAISSRTHQSAVPAKRTRFVTGFWADLISQMHGADSGEAIFTGVTGLFETAFSRFTCDGRRHFGRSGVWRSGVWCWCIGNCRIHHCGIHHARVFFRTGDFTSTGRKDK
jgi:hypothetical protein